MAQCRRSVGVGPPPGARRSHGTMTGATPEASPDPGRGAPGVFFKFIRWSLPRLPVSKTIFSCAGEICRRGSDHL